MARRWRLREHITALEAESAVPAVRAICREHAGRGQRHLVLSDSMSCVHWATTDRGECFLRCSRRNARHRIAGAASASPAEVSML